MKKLPGNLPLFGSRIGLQERGFALIASLMMMVLVTIVLLGMARSFWLQEGMAGNLREKIRALNAAQTALNNAERWLTSTGKNQVRVTCAGVGYSAVAKVCSDAVVISSTTMPPLNQYSTYTPTGMTVNTAGGAGTFYAAPGYYIQYLGETVKGTGIIFSVTSYGYGGNREALAIIQSNLFFEYAARGVQ